MVAAEPDKWIWDFKKENCFKAKYIEAFHINMKSSDEYIVRVNCKDGTFFILDSFEKHSNAIEYVNNFIKGKL